MASTPSRRAEAFAAAFKVFGSTVEGPATVRRPEVAALGGDQDVGGGAAVRGQRPGNQGLVVAELVVAELVVADLVRAETVRVGGIDQGHAGIVGGVNGRD
jgi:hypothetical protein